MTLDIESSPPMSLPKDNGTEDESPSCAPGSSDDQNQPNIGSLGTVAEEANIPLPDSSPNSPVHVQSQLPGIPVPAAPQPTPLPAFRPRGKPKGAMAGPKPPPTKPK
ncbi:hypothetical protein K474DRAFT_1660610 [Panus rudis PR-1116 ss-1]|nr:hypothetical protein K474DRAFT_1660610 [Panus rudis PR-1116 ss-1]